MSSNTNNLSREHVKVAARQLQEAEITIDEFLQLADVYYEALIPEKVAANIGSSSSDFEHGMRNGFNQAIDQTRRNLIGEQHDDSEGSGGGSQPTRNHVMPEAPASGKEK